MPSRMLSQAPPLFVTLRTVQIFSEDRSMPCQASLHRNLSQVLSDKWGLSMISSSIAPRTVSFKISNCRNDCILAQTFKSTDSESFIGWAVLLE